MIELDKKQDKLNTWLLLLGWKRFICESCPTEARQDILSCSPDKRSPF
jgi:hypothetical protein